MQSAFYKLSGVLPVTEAIALIKKDIHDLYSYKG